MDFRYAGIRGATGGAGAADVYLGWGNAGGLRGAEASVMWFLAEPAHRI
ncbi:MAG: hypothetical protein MR006_02015 [Arcanobacterium sp.]|nr:hypothetical protein [Arcanobacterium sp.]MDY5588485.1 hypothetical protein [Arcanobacterium sp.]